MKTSQIAALIVTSALIAGAALVAEAVLTARPAFAQTTKALTLAWGTGTSAGTSSSNITLVRLTGNGNGGAAYYLLSIASAASGACNIRTASFDQAIALQTRISAPNVTRVECADSASGKTTVINLSYPLSPTQGLLIDSTP
jgi:hypothetical protein